MKSTFFLASIVLVILFLGCKEKKENEINSENKVIFKIDERTEFFRTIFNIAVQDDLPEDIRSCQTEYVERVNNHFLPFKNHPLIRWVYDDENIGIDFSTIGLMMKDLENFEFDTIYRKELQQYGITQKTLDSIRPLMKDFYKKTAFKKFFKSNEQYYEKSISKIEKQVSEEKLFDKVINFYQSKQNGLELIVFVELTNSANNKAVDFYDTYNPNKRAIILANYCDDYTKPNASNEILALDNSIRGVLYHEISHLFTTKLLDKHIGDLNQYKSVCEDCNTIETIDKVDHMIVSPLQALMMYRFDNNSEGNDFYLNKCTDVRKEIYKRLTEYDKEDKIPFEKIYIDCLNLIKNTSNQQLVN